VVSASRPAGRQTPDRRGGKASSFVPGAAVIATDWQEGYPDAVDFARTLVHCIDVPDNCIIEEVNIWGTEQFPEMVNPY